MRQERGEYWVICERCGKQYGNHQCHREELTNSFVCHWCLDYINEQIYGTVISESSFPSLVFKSPDSVASICVSNTAIAGEAIAGCMIAGDSTPGENPFYIGQLV